MRDPETSQLLEVIEDIAVGNIPQTPLKEETTDPPAKNDKDGPSNDERAELLVKAGLASLGFLNLLVVMLPQFLNLCGFVVQ